ncbi:divalent metal cation transporter [Brachybacterium endophyticum]|uniref:Divalent metal cation transporter n=1 Tax=Brachybacterium endophyticum TaxID=2182385 RepID=A0A2U2RKD8_9MICO|nr:Nramp family divalent metal transporter [Brachybacterium endophyticum]PWH06306.1 divalent metal cation transporter [Brachybacterium endophyticum]
MAEPIVHERFREGPPSRNGSASGGERTPRPRRTLRLLGPAFVAAVAYVDPGNIAANITAGARHGYLLLWVLVVANAMAMLVQYLSAKLGAVTGRTLADHLGRSLGRRSRLLFWLQAQAMAIATDVAEVVGGAIALRILFGLPLLVGGIIVGVVSMGLLAVQSRYGQRPFERVVIGLLAVITIGFLAGLFVAPPDPVALAEGLVPRFDGAGTVVLAASMLGATVMPHAIYLHAGLVRDRHGTGGGPVTVDRVVRASRWDVALSLCVAGTVNIAMLVLAAEALPGIPGTDTIEGAQHAIAAASGPVIGVLFGIGLLASGLASSSVGAYAGAEILQSMLHVRIPLVVSRALTLLPALLVLALGTEPTAALVLSQVVLSLCLPFALIPLVALTSRRALMGRFANARVVTVIAWIVVALIIALNLALVPSSLAGG